ncbi:MSCRAMM family protein [Glaciimonas sp. GG7]
MKRSLTSDYAHRVVLVVLLMLLVLSPFMALAAPPVEDQNLVLLDVQLDGDVLTEAMTTYQYGSETFLPLGELARLLTLAIKTHPAQGTADGYVLSEARSFSLNLTQASIMLSGKTQSVDPALIKFYGDDIYVASTLLARWLPLDLEVDLSRLTLRVKPRERLPLQERLEREHKGAKASNHTHGYQDPQYPRLAMPYRLLGVPFIDQTLGLGASASNGNRQTSASYTAYLTTDLLGTEAALYVSSNQQKPTPDLRFTLARHDPDAGLLGPLRARSVMFGNGVSVPGVTNIGNTTPVGHGYGLMLSNRPLNQPTSFDRHTLQGDLPPGWDVELYFNEALVGFQAARADGRYSFDDQPLSYGNNAFRLVFHGPLGQQRVEKQEFLLDQSSTPPGMFYYSITEHRDDAGASRSVAQFEWGLNKYLTATGAMVRMPATLGSNAAAQLYSSVGLRGFWQSFILSNNFSRSSNGGWLNDAELKTRLGSVAVSYTHLLLNDFSSQVFSASADPLKTRDNLRLDGALSTGFLPRLPVSIELQRDQFQSGTTNLSLSGRIAAYLNRTAISNQVTLQSANDTTSASGNLQLSRRVGELGLNSQLGYSIKPHATLETVVLSGDHSLGQAYLLTLGLVRSVHSAETSYTAALNKSLGSYGLGLSTSYASHSALTVGLQLFIAMGREPRQAQWHFNALPKADSGAASVRVFLDNNGDGVMNAGDEPLKNVAITVNGSRTQARTDAAGIAWLDRLPTGENVDIAVDPQTLEDPYWTPQLKGLRLVPRPGHVAELDFPVTMTSEIDGTVYLVDKTSKRGLGDTNIEVLDINRKLLTTVKTSSDGYYIVPAVAKGLYFLQIAPQQLKQFHLIDPGLRAITVLPDGNFIDGVDFLLHKKEVASPG